MEQISATLGELRQAAGDGPKSRQLLDSIFRETHSLKAAAAADGFEELSRVAHQFEDLLHSLRTGKVGLDEAVFPVFAEITDALFASLEKPRATPSGRFTLAKSTEIEPDIGLDSFPALKGEERYRLAESLREGSNLYLVEVDFDLADFEQQFRKLKEELSKSGEVISTSAKVDGNHTDQINFKVLYAAREFVVSGVNAREILQTVLQQAVRAGQSAAAALGKEIQFVTRGGELSLDKALCEAIADPLIHLVRNAVDHGIEQHGQILIEATTAASEARIRVTDDGRGIDPANISLIFQPGFSTATEVSTISGRGVGLDVVKSAIETAGGTVTVRSEPNKGTTFEIVVPLIRANLR